MRFFSSSSHLQLLALLLLLLFLALTNTPRMTLAASSSQQTPLGVYHEVFNVFGDITFPRGQTEAFTGTRAAANALVQKGGAPFAVIQGQDMNVSKTANSEDAESLTFPFAVAGLGIAYNIASQSGMELTVNQVGLLLRGDQPFSITMYSGTVPSSSLRIALCRDLAYLHVIEAEGHHEHLAAFSDDFEAVVKANPNVMWFDTDAAALEYSKATVNTIALATFMEAVQHHMPVAGVLVDHPQYVQHGLQIAMFPKLTSSALVTIDKDSALHVHSATVPTYPFVAPAIMLISHKYACTHRDDAWFQQLTRLMAANFEQWHMLPLPPFLLNAAISKAIAAMEASCTAATVVPSKGSSAIQDLVTGLSRQHLLDTSSSSNQQQQPVFVSYSGGGSGGGLAAIKAGTHPVVGSDSLFSAEEYADYPAVQFVPITSFAVSLAYNLPGIDSLVLPRCVVVGIFKGEVTFWDDAAIRKYNPTALIPHQRIHVWARESRSGTTGIFTAGLRRMDEVCMGGISGATFNQSKTFDPRFANLNLTQSSSGVLAGVAAVPYSIGYSSASSVRQRGLSEAVLVDELGGNEVTSPKDEATLQAAVSDATLDEQKMVLSFKASARAYPFSGVSYLVYESRVSGVDCGRQRAVLEFAKWAIVSEKAATYAGSIDFVALPAETRELVRLKLLEATCDGEHVLEQDPVAAEASNMAAVLGGSIGGAAFVLLALVGVVVVMRQKDAGRDNSCAPKDNSQPFTIMFTDIESSTALWARAPLSMGPALDAHNEIIRAAIQRHSCYEVKTIGDAFMVACPSPEVAVSLAMDIQRDLFRYPWECDDISALYGELHAEKGWALVHGTVSDKLWNGLRVRIGIAHGEAAAKLDEVSGGYDYFGSTVNMASRVEAAGHGGQVLVTKCMYEQLPAERTSREKKFVVSDLGNVHLKGFDAPVPLFQLLPDELHGRSFAALRLDAVDKMESEAETSVVESRSDAESGTMTWETGRTRDNSRSPAEGTSVSDAADSTSRGSGGSLDEVLQLVSIPKQEQMLLRLNILESLLTPLRESEKRKFIERLCTGWRVEVKKNSDHLKKAVYDNLMRRAFAVSRSHDSKLGRKPTHPRDGRSASKYSQSLDAPHRYSTTSGGARFPDGTMLSLSANDGRLQLMSHSVGTTIDLHSQLASDQRTTASHHAVPHNLLLATPPLDSMAHSGSNYSNSGGGELSASSAPLNAVNVSQIPESD